MGGFCAGTIATVKCWHWILNIHFGNPLSPLLFNLSLQKLMKSIKMVPSGIKIGKEQLNVFAYADDIALIGKK